MQSFEPVSIEQLVALPPTIFGVIRWKKYIGRPTGDLCGGFNIRVEEHTATQFRAVGGGKYEPIPGTGIWKDVADSVSCRGLPDEGDYHMLSFQIWGPRIHLNAFPDGQYRITPTLKGLWIPGSVVVLFGSRTSSQEARLSCSKRITKFRALEFEVVQRRRFFGSILGAATVGLVLGLVLQRAKPNTSSPAG